MRQYSQRPWYNDVRSKQFSHNRFFGVTTIPATLGRTFYPPLNQGQTMECAAFAAAQNGRYIHGTEMEPQWQVSKISRLQGYDVATQGSDPNSAMDSQLVIKQGGYLPKTLYIAGQEAALDIQASNYGDAAYLKIIPSNGQDYFDAICSALTLAYDSTTGNGQGVQAFTAWYDSFDVPNITATGNLLGYHSYDFLDFDRTNADPNQHVIKFQNSYGQDITPNGVQTMTRSVVNNLLTQPGTTAKIVKTMTADQIALAQQNTLYGYMQRLIMSFWQTLTNAYGMV